MSPHLGAPQLPEQCHHFRILGCPVCGYENLNTVYIYSTKFLPRVDLTVTAKLILAKFPHVRAGPMKSTMFSEPDPRKVYMANIWRLFTILCGFNTALDQHKAL